MQSDVTQTKASPESPSRFKSWRVPALISFVLSVAASAPTAYFVSIKQHEVDTYRLLSDKGSHLMEQLVNHPELRPYIYENKELCEDENHTCKKMRQRVLAIAEMWIDFSEYVVLMRAKLSEEDRLGWENYLCFVYNSSTVIQDYISDRQIRKWYDRDLLKLWEDKCPACN